MGRFKGGRGGKNPYTIATNRVLHNKKLSTDARFLFTYLWSRGDDWYLSYPHLKEYLGWGDERAHKAVAQLELSGHLVVHKKPVFRNRRPVLLYDLYEIPRVFVNNEGVVECVTG